MHRLLKDPIFIRDTSNKNPMQHIVTYYKQLERPDNMPDMELKQLQYESDIWKRLLGFIMEKNCMSLTELIIKKI